VVLNGDGGDEAFAGYARPIVARAAETFRGVVPRALRPTAARLLARTGKKGRMLAAAGRQTAREAFVYDRGLRRVRAELYSSSLLSRLNGGHPDALYSQVWSAADGPTDLDRALFGDLSTYLPDQLLVKMDVSTMAHSVEARSPLLDQALVEFAASIPVDQMSRGYQTKYLLKRLAERYVPREVLYRRKRGFVMPVSAWLRGELAGDLRAILTSPTARARGLFSPATVGRILDEHASSRRDWGNQLWTLLVLEIWYRIFIDRSVMPDQLLSSIEPAARSRAFAATPAAVLY
jgi:asparagine synthase (glutamine-hydrolysing)